MKEIDGALNELANLISYRFPGVELKWMYDMLNQEYLIRVEEQSGKHVDKHISLSTLLESRNPLDFLGFEIRNVVAELSQQDVE